MEDGPSIHDLPWTPYEHGVGAAPRIVLLLLDDRASISVPIRRAARMTDALDAKLHVVLALSRGEEPTQVVACVSDVLRATSPRYGHELEVVQGPIAEVGYATARDVEASMVVVDARFGTKAACRLADQLGTPVLVARDGRAEGDWIAATDMQHGEFPVLSTARELARAVDRDIIFFHNAKPVPVFFVDPMSGAGGYVDLLKRQDDAAAAKRARLAHLASTDRRARSIVTRGGDTVDVLLELARERDADMVVVGHSRRSWWQRLFGNGTTERLVDRTRRSVLIVPLDGRER